MKLSVVMPVFNESQSIGTIVEKVLTRSCVGELIIVDDVSTDGSREKVLSLARRDERVRVILHGTNRGKGAAVRTGIENCTQDAVIIQDADLEYDPNDYQNILAPIEQDLADVVYGSRYLDRGLLIEQPLSYRVANWGLTQLSNWFTGLQLTDMETCYKCFRRDILGRLRLEEDRFGIEAELTAKVAALGCRFREVKIEYSSRNRSEGKKIGLRDGIEAVVCIIRHARASKKSHTRMQ